MSMATLQAGRAQESLRVGDPFPELKGRCLTGRDAALPQAASGKVTLVEVPMIGGLATLGRWFIDRNVEP